jgi:hypothetical protein
MNSPRTTIGRGVVSLAAEPSYYSIQALMLLILNWLNCKDNDRQRYLAILTEWILIFQILFLSQSFFGLLLLGTFLATRTFINRPLLSAAAIFAGLLIFFLVRHNLATWALEHSESSRVLKLAGEFIINPFKLTTSDQSAGERFTDIALSLYSVTTEPVLTPGQSTIMWPEYVDSVRPLFPSIKHAIKGPRIMSGLGTAIFELGSMGIVLIASILNPVIKRNRENLVIVLFLPLALLTAIPLALPLVGIILGFSITPRKSSIIYQT